MLPREKGNKDKRGEPRYIVAMESRVNLIEEELTKMKAVIEEIHLQTIQNQNAMEVMRKEATDNQSKLIL